MGVQQRGREVAAGIAGALEHAALAPHLHLGVLLPTFVVFGVASGMVFPSFIAASVVDVPSDRHAIGSGMNFTSQRVGTTLGVAFAITFLTGSDGAVTGFGRVAVLAVIGGALCLLTGLAVDTRPRST